MGRRVVSEDTQGVTRNSEAAQVLGRIMMLPIVVLREILRHLDTKLIPEADRGVWDQMHRRWTGTQPMRNKARLRRRVFAVPYYVEAPDLTF